MASTAYFKIKPASGGWRAYFYAANHELVWWTEVYKYYAGAQNAVTFAQQNAASAPLL